MKPEECYEFRCKGHHCIVCRNEEVEWEDKGKK